MLNMKRLLPLALFLLFAALHTPTSAQLHPAITHWVVNADGQTGFAGIPTNVQLVQYSASNVYVSTSDIADWIPVGYDWPNNPWSPENQSFVFKITLNPARKPANPIATPYGHIGIWTNGVSIYNPKDAKSYRDSGAWFQNAIYFEHLDTETMDSCLGHPNNRHEYHLHVHPKCLWDEYDSARHAPLIGYAFDGFPIYGSYGFANTDGTGGIVRLRSSYRLRSITERTTLPDGTALAPAYHGPTLAQYPLGAYVEDYEYVAGLGDLDEHNGRFCVTPEYPGGTYAYFVTLQHDGNGRLEPAYPYVLGPTFYGIVQPGNTGPNSGKNSITEPTTVLASVDDVAGVVPTAAYPNPASTEIHLAIGPSYSSGMTATLYDSRGAALRTVVNIGPAATYDIDVRDLPNGRYFLMIDARNVRVRHSILIKH